MLLITVSRLIFYHLSDLSNFQIIRSRRWMGQTSICAAPGTFLRSSWRMSWRCILQISLLLRTMALRLRKLLRRPEPPRADWEVPNLKIQWQCCFGYHHEHFSLRISKPLSLSLHSENACDGSIIQYQLLFFLHILLSLIPKIIVPTRWLHCNCNRKLELGVSGKL